jgi:hypothetical protein
MEITNPVLLWLLSISLIVALITVIYAFVYSVAALGTPYKLREIRERLEETDKVWGYTAIFVAVALALGCGFWWLLGIAPERAYDYLGPGLLFIYQVFVPIPLYFYIKFFIRRMIGKHPQEKLNLQIEDRYYAPSATWKYVPAVRVLLVYASIGVANYFNLGMPTFILWVTTALLIVGRKILRSSK